MYFSLRNRSTINGTLLGYLNKNTIYNIFKAFVFLVDSIMIFINHQIQYSYRVCTEGGLLGTEEELDYEGSRTGDVELEPLD